MDQGDTATKWKVWDCIPNLFEVRFPTRDLELGGGSQQQQSWLTDNVTGSDVSSRGKGKRCSSKLVHPLHPSSALVYLTNTEGSSRVGIILRAEDIEPNGSRSHGVIVRKQVMKYVYDTMGSDAGVSGDGNVLGKHWKL